jgi:nucleoside-diphosphate-sugar epimerase
MNILVTGGAGYVGTSLIPVLLAYGHEVTVFDSLLHGGDVLIPFFRDSKFKFIKGDIRDYSALEIACKGADIVIHLAAIVGLPACNVDPDLTEQVNYQGTVNVSNAAKNSYILFGSTGSNYGEVIGQMCTEETPLNPLSLYGTTKTRAEQYLMKHNACTAFRFATAFGLSPRLRLDLLANDLTYQAVRNKFAVVYEANFMRTFIHVYDMARAFLFAIDNRDKMQGQVYNIGNESMNFSKREICEIIAEETGAMFHYAEIGKDGDKRNYVVSYEKIRNLGFDTTVTVREGVQEMVRGLQVIKIRNPYANV